MGRIRFEEIVRVSLIVRDISYSRMSPRVSSLRETSMSVYSTDMGMFWGDPGLWNRDYDPQMQFFTRNPMLFFVSATDPWMAGYGRFENCQKIGTYSCMDWKSALTSGCGPKDVRSIFDFFVSGSTFSLFPSFCQNVTWTLC